MADKWVADVIIRPAAFEEVDVHAKWCIELGWGTQHRFRVIHLYDPAGYLVAEHPHTGQLLGFISSCKFGTSSKSAIGNFIVHHDYQGRGIGSKLFGACLEYLNDQNTILLHATQEGMPIYVKRGFTEVRSPLLTCRIQKNNSPDTLILKADDDCDVEFVQLKADMIPDLVDYDTDIHTVSRARFIREYVLGGEVHTVVARNAGVIEGYGCLEEMSAHRYLMGPVYADSPATGQSIFTKLVSMASENSSITFIFYNNNSIMHSLASRYGEEMIFRTPCLVKGEDPPITMEKVFCVIGGDIGLV